MTRPIFCSLHQSQTLNSDGDMVLIFTYVMGEPFKITDMAGGVRSLQRRSNSEIMLKLNLSPAAVKGGGFGRHETKS